MLKRVAEMADWGAPVPEGRERGVAVLKSFDTYVAQIVEVSRGEDGVPRVHKVWCAVDCGVADQSERHPGADGGRHRLRPRRRAVRRDHARRGRQIVQSNFHDYRSLRINEMPEVEVAVIASTEKPTGVGEPGVPPIGPAVANAWRAPDRRAGAPPADRSRRRVVRRPP